MPLQGKTQNISCSTHCGNTSSKNVQFSQTFWTRHTATQLHHVSQKVISLAICKSDNLMHTNVAHRAPLLPSGNAPGAARLCQWMCASSMCVPSAATATACGCKPTHNCNHNTAVGRTLLNSKRCHVHSYQVHACIPGCTPCAESAESALLVHSAQHTQDHAHAMNPWQCVHLSTTSTTITTACRRQSVLPHMLPHSVCGTVHT